MTEIMPDRPADRQTDRSGHREVSLPIKPMYVFLFIIFNSWTTLILLTAKIQTFIINTALLIFNISHMIYITQRLL